MERIPWTATWTALAMGMTGCTTTNPRYDAGADAMAPDAALRCDPSSCSTGRCVDHRCAEPCDDGGACPPGETCCEQTYCTNLADDSQSCGVCGLTCGPREMCSAGVCSAVPL